MSNDQTMERPVPVVGPAQETPQAVELPPYSQPYDTPTGYQQGYQQQYEQYDGQPQAGSGAPVAPYQDPYTQQTPAKRSVLPIVLGVGGVLAIVGIVVAGFFTNWFGVTGGGGGLFENDETIIRRQVSSLFETLKHPTEEDIRVIMDGDALTEIERYDIDPAELLTHFFKYLDYSIDSVSIDGDRATVELTVTNVDFNEVVNNVYAKLEEPEFYAEAFAAYMQGDEAAIVRWMLNLMYDLIDESSDTRASNQMTLHLQKDENGTWQFTDLDYDKLVSGLFGNIDDLL